MTLDLIHGNSFLARAFDEGLVHWRSDLINLGATRISAQSWAQLNQSNSEFFGHLSADKTIEPTRIVHHDPIPVVPSQYLEMKFTVTLTSGPEINARIIGAAATSAGAILPGFATNGPWVELKIGTPVEVTAIVGSGARAGVDLAWDADVAQGYFGIELSGPNGGHCEIANLRVSDVTGFFLSTNGDWVDIRDFGAIGDGNTDNVQALLDTDAQAGGRAIFIPKGDFFIGSDITLHSPIRAYGRFIADANTAVMLGNVFDLESYVHAFKDEVIAFEKAVQALFRFSDHNGLDLCGRRVALTRPVDVAALAAPRTQMTANRSIYNGQIEAIASNDWDNLTITKTASYSANNSLQLTNIANAAQIPVGSLVQGNGVGREIFVTAVDSANGTVTLTEQLNNPNASQSYTFTRFRFMLDFSGFGLLSRFEARNIDFYCNGNASAMLLARDGTACKFSHNWVYRPKNRGICSYDGGCNGLTVESCNFSSNESTLDAEDRQSIAITTHRNDMKIRNNRAEYFRHFAVLGGGGHLIVGNHWFQGNKSGGSSRTAGLITMYKKSKSTINGNYIDNCWLEFSDEQDVAVANGNSQFGDTVITGNIFQAHNVPNWFRFIILAPHSTGHGIDGFSVCNNTFSLWAGNDIARVEGIDTSNGNIDLGDIRNLRFANNSYSKITNESHSPATKRITQANAAQNWLADFSDIFPFGAPATTPVSICLGQTASTNEMPRFATRQGATGSALQLLFTTAASGAAYVTARCDAGD